MKKISVRFVAESAIIAALYVALTWMLAPISYGAIQFRISEALLVLVLIKPSYAFAFIIGCFISNTTSSLGWYDMVFGTLATVIGVIPMMKIKNPFISSIFPVVSNAIIVAIELYFALDIKPIWLSMLTVGMGEAVVVFFLGIPLLYAIRRNVGLMEMLGIKNTNDNFAKSLEFMGFIAIFLAVLGAILFFAYPIYEKTIMAPEGSITETFTLYSNMNKHWWVLFLCIIPVIYSLLFLLMRNCKVKWILSFLLVIGMLFCYFSIGAIHKEAFVYPYYYGYFVYLIFMFDLILLKIKKTK